MNPYQGQPPAQYGAPPPPRGYGQGMGQLVLEVEYFFTQPRLPQAGSGGYGGPR